jgi:hypothetical protein
VTRFIKLSKPKPDRKPATAKSNAVVCTAPFGARNDEFVLKYFLLRKANRKKWTWQRRALLADTQDLSNPRAARAAETAAVLNRGSYIDQHHYRLLQHRKSRQVYVN